MISIVLVFQLLLIFPFDQTGFRSPPKAGTEIQIDVARFSKCKEQELWKTRKSGGEICTQQSGKTQWEPALSNNDVYQVSDFCSKLIYADQCEWTERAGLALVRGKGPRDSCVKLLRAVVYAIAKANKLNIDPNGFAGEAISNNKKFCFDENPFPR